MIQTVREVDLAQVDVSVFKHRYAGCMVVTRDQRIILQQRGPDWQRFPGYLCEFGGRIEADESPIEAVIRELKEELGASVHAEELIPLGAITEQATRHTELVYLYFWHDKNNTITGCYEGRIAYFTDLDDIVAQPRVMDSVHWLLTACQNQNLLK